MRVYAGIRHYRTLRHPRGMILITVTWIAIALAAVVLVLAREMMVESITARQHMDQAKADAAEQGMEQYVESVLEQEAITPGYKDQEDWEMRRIGDCWCWVMMYNNDDERKPAFGITDEAAKVDLNTTTADILDFLPGMEGNTQLEGEITDWVDPDDDVGTDGISGAESSNYTNSVNYRAKNAPFESVEELRLLLSLQGTDRDTRANTEMILHGADTNHNHVLDQVEEQNANGGLSFSTSMVGIEPFVTVYGLRATPLPVPNAPTSNSNTGGSVISGGINSSSTGDQTNYIADVNSSSSQAGQAALLYVLQQYLPDTSRAQTIVTATYPQTQGGGGGGGGQATTTKYKNIWDWATKMQSSAQVHMTQDEFNAIYLHVMCSFPPVSTTSTTTATTPIAGGTTTAPATQPTAPVGRVNVNTVPKAVLMCLPSFEEQDADSIIAYREANLTNTYNSDPTQIPNIAWLMDQNQVQIDPQKLVDAGCYLTGVSSVYSADIVTVSPDGRAFKRVKIVVDVTSGTPQIIYRRDMSKEGWPLDPKVRETLKKGGEPERIGPLISGG